MYIHVHRFIQSLHMCCVYLISFKPEKSPLVCALVLHQGHGPRLGTCGVVAKHRIFLGP
jgi:hypothetical protein